MHGGKANTTRAIVLTAAVLLAVALLPRVAAAIGTPADTVITNQATVSYQDAAANSYSEVSNTTSVTVLPVYSLAITSPADQSVPSNTTVYYGYTLTNNGNATDNVTLAAASVTGGNDFIPVAVLIDTNGNGFHDPGEDTAVTNPVSVAADAVYRFLVAVTVPAGTANGQTDDTQLTADGLGAGVPDATDTVTTTAQAPALAVLKDVRNVTTSGVFTGTGTADATPTQVLEYQVTVTNNGPVAASNVVLSDPINVNTGFIVGSATFDPGTSGLTGATIDYRCAGAWGCTPTGTGCGAPAGADYCVTDIRWTGTGSMASGPTSFSTTFRVQVK